MGVGGALPSSISPFLLTQSFCWVSPLETLFSFPPHFGPCRYNWISRFSLSKAGFSCYCCTGQKRKREEIDATISKLRVFFCLFFFNVLVWLSLLAFAPASFPVVVASSSLSPPTAPSVAVVWVLDMWSVPGLSHSSLLGGPGVVCELIPPTRLFSSPLCFSFLPGPSWEAESDGR